MARTEVRRLEGQALAVFGERGLQFGQRGAGAHRDHQLAGLVAGDAGEGAGVQYGAVQGLAVEILGAAAADAQRLAAGCGGADALGGVGQGGVG